MSASSADRNLLFGVLAHQADFLDASQFAEACSAWAGRKDTPLADLLVERGWLTAEDKGLVERLLDKKLQKHGGDAHASLAAVADKEVRQALGTIDDAVVQKSVADLFPADYAVLGTVAPSSDAPGRYSLTRLHGKGGIGQVWLARDNDLGREVALKELRPDRAGNPALIARFLEEAKVTGQLEHPGIVPVYELARRPTDQQPYYAMRFIQGRTLADATDDYHRKRQSGQSGPLDLRALLGAFVAVCNAVAYAHSRGVIHRDLKGQNVVLGDFGEVMVLDWGLAKLLAEKEEPAGPLPVTLEKEESRDQTRQGQVLGTPAYMPPEQAEGRLDRVDRRSDVYSLGAVLYDLLTGEPPFDGPDTLEVLKKVVHEPPVPPRHKVPSTPAALEAVCLKALAKSPEARYASAQGLAEEVQRWLADEPVGAYREPLRVRAGRWVRRHRTKVTAAVAAVVVAAACLAASTGLLAAANQRERDAKKEVEKQRDRADMNLAKARKAVEDFCTDVAEDERLKQADLHPLRKKLLLTAVPFYEEFVKQRGDDTQLEADRGKAYFRLALLRGELGEQSEAVAGFEAALATFTQLNQEDRAVPGYRQLLASSQSSLGVLLDDLGRREEAEKAYRKALDLREELVRDFPAVPEYRRDLAISHNNLGNLWRDLGRREEAKTAYKKGLDLREGLVRDFPAVPEYRRDLAKSQYNLAILLNDLGRRGEAEGAYRKALDLYDRLAGDFPAVPSYRHGLAKSHNNLGVLLNDLGRREEANETYRKALDLFEGLARDFPAVPGYRRDWATCYECLGDLLHDLRRREEAEEAYKKSLAVREGLARDFPAVPEHRQHLARSHSSLGRLLKGTGRREEAEKAYRKAMELWEGLAHDFPTVPEYRQELAKMHNNLGILLKGTGRREEAEKAYRKALDLFEKLARDFPAVPEHRHDLASSHFNLGILLNDLSRREEAEEACRKALTLFEGLARDFPTLPEYRQELVQVQVKHSVFLARMGNHTKAVAEANVLAESPGVRASTLYSLSCVFSLSSAAIKIDAKLADQYATRGVELLRQAVAKGFKDVSYIKKDTDLDPLRSRDDFKSLVSDLEKATKPAPAGRPK